MAIIDRKDHFAVRRTPSDRFARSSLNPALDAEPSGVRPSTGRNRLQAEASCRSVSRPAASFNARHAFAACLLERSATATHAHNGSTSCHRSRKAVRPTRCIECLRSRVDRPPTEGKVKGSDDSTSSCHFVTCPIASPTRASSTPSICAPPEFAHPLAATLRGSLRVDLRSFTDAIGQSPSHPSACRS